VASNDWGLGACYFIIQPLLFGGLKIRKLSILSSATEDKRKNVKKAK